MNKVLQRTGTAISRFFTKIIFKRFKPMDYAFYLGSVGSLILATVLFSASPIALFSTIMGITAASVNMKANKVSFIFYMIMSLVYGCLSFSSKFYGEFALNIFYLFPLYLYSTINWLRHKEEYVTVEIFTVTKKLCLVFAAIAAVVIPVYGYVLGMLGTALPYLNSTSTMLCAFAAFLTAKRMKESWLAWIALDVVLLIIWFFDLSNNQSLDNIALFLEKALFIVISVRGYISWVKMQKLLAE